MEKDTGRLHFPAQPGRGMRRSSYAILLTLLLWLLFHALNIPNLWRIHLSERLTHTSSTMLDEFRWNQINPTTYLNYTSCFGKFQCARLDVPMDWNSTSSDGPRVTVAIVRLPAPVSVVDPRYGGIILTNPGGPGGSGVNQALTSAEKFSRIINPSSSCVSSRDEKYFDIMSFDPRGVNNTTPSLKCFPNAFSYDTWRYQQLSDGIDHSSSTALSNLWARSKAATSGCSKSELITSHMNTPPVVADMVDIIERHAEWRSKEAELWLASDEAQSLATEQEPNHPFSKRAIIERTRWRKGEEKLQYWGFSYGSLLGATFAALQPHRVKRVILDGVEESTDYYSTAWRLNLKDTDKIIDKFYEYCSAAGPEKCALNSGTSDPADIRKSFESLISDIREDPVAVPGSLAYGPDVITYSNLMEIVRTSLYKPLELFPLLANLSADLKGNGSAFAEFKQGTLKPSCPLQECKEKDLSEPCYPNEAMETTSGIMCSDGAALLDSTKEGFKDYAASLYNQSRWLGELWAPILAKCYHWKGKAAWRIKSDDIKGNTSHPILWIGNTLDPVTPLSNAYIMAAKFPGSVVLEQESEGHCSLSSPSLCTAKYIREYFQTGKLPKPGTVCQPEERPLVGSGEPFVVRSAQDETILLAMKDLAKESGVSRFLGSR